VTSSGGTAPFPYRGAMPDQPGWYPDPARPDHARWFDGSRWSSHVRAAAPPPVPVGSAPPAVPGWEPPQPVAPPYPEPSPGNVVTRNLFSLLGVLVGIAFVGISAQQGQFAIGLLPIGLTVFGYKLHERLAAPAMAVAALLFVVDLVLIAR
jgi:hypothetical protein